MIKTGLISIADLGDIGNLKEEPTLMIYSALHKIDNSSLLYVRDYKNFSKFNAKKIFFCGRYLSYFFEGTKKYLLKNFDARANCIKTMDFIIKKKLSNELDLVYVIPPSFPKTLKQVKENKGITIMHAGVLHPNSSLEELRVINQKIADNELLYDTINQSKYIFALSELTKKTYVDNGFKEENIYVVPLGVDINKFKSKKQKKKELFKVICIGDYGPLKGFQYVLEAWKNLNLKNAELTFIGNPEGGMIEEVKIYKKLLKNFKTYSHTDPLPFLQSSSVLVHPSLSDSWGKVVTEAMACGLPTIVSKNTGAKDAVIDNETGFIIPTNSVKAIEEKLLYLYKNQKKAQEMGFKARKHVEENFIWEKSTEKAYQAFKEIIKKEKLE